MAGMNCPVPVQAVCIVFLSNASQRTLLTRAGEADAKRTTFNAFYTSPAVITAIHDGFARLGVPADATAVEPGCGSGTQHYLLLD